MNAAVLYDDGRVVLDDEGVTLRRYYFPTAGAKHIPYRAIRRVGVRPMGWLSGRARLWGGNWIRLWMPHDSSRFGKHELVILDLGAKVNPAFTPDDLPRVVALIRERIPAEDV